MQSELARPLLTAAPNMSTTLSPRPDTLQHATHQNPRNRTTATTQAVALLDRAERRLLERAAEAGGSCSISGLAREDMVHVASVALMLQWRGFVRAKIHFTQGVPGQPESLHCELTDEGLQCLASELSPI
jgi:hypothetical protein